MANLEPFLTVKEAAAFLGVSQNMICDWDRDGKLSVYRHPINRYRLFKQNMVSVLRQIEQSGKYPTGWPRTAKRNRKPR